MKTNNAQFGNFNRRYYTTDGYDDYLRRFAQEGESFVKKLLKIISPQKDWCFLDLGCGMGGDVLALRKLGFQSYGVEVSPFCLAHSPAKEWLSFGSATEIPHPDNFFNVVICKDVFCYLTPHQMTNAATEISRVGRQYLYLETISRESPNSSQTLNPDPLRKDKYLPTHQFLIDLFSQHGWTFVKKLFPKTKDFTGLFAKNSR